MRDPGLREHARAELQVGILVLVAVLVTIVGVFYLTGTKVGGHELQLHGVTSEAGEMTSGSRVYLLGVDVGSVADLRLDGLRVLVDLSLDFDGGLPADTRGIIRASGFLGSQRIDLIPGKSAEALASGDTIQLDREADLQSLAGDLGDETTLILKRIRDALSEETVGDIRASSSAMAAAMRQLESLVSSQRETIHQLLANLEATTGQLAKATEGPELDRAVARLDSLSDRLNSAGAGLDSSSTSLASILDRLDAGKGTLGKLLTDENLYEDVRDAVSNLQGATEEIAMLMKDVRERPDRYLKGLKISVF